MRKIISGDTMNKCRRLGGLDELEKEVRGFWRDVGIPHLWAMMGMLCCSAKFNNCLTSHLGNLARCRFHSKHIALRMWLHVKISSPHLTNDLADRDQSDWGGGVWWALWAWYLKGTKSIRIKKWSVRWQDHPNRVQYYDPRMILCHDQLTDVRLQKSL